MFADGFVSQKRGAESFNDSIAATLHVCITSLLEYSYVIHLFTLCTLEAYSGPAELSDRVIGIIFQTINYLTRSSDRLIGLETGDAEDKSLRRRGQSSACTKTAPFISNDVYSATTRAGR